MRGSLRILTVRGIPIRIHWSFLLVLPLLAFAFGRSALYAARAAGLPRGALHGNLWVWARAWRSASSSRCCCTSWRTRSMAGAPARWSRTSPCS